MKQPIKNWILTLGVILSVGLLFSFSFCPVFAQESFPKGGTDFDSATEITPGQYRGGQLDWEEGTIMQQFYYLNGIKGGQAIEAVIKFAGNTNLDVSLYDGDKVKLTDVYGGNDIDILAWLVGSSTKAGKYYLVLKNDAISQATSISLDLKINDDYDANAATDAGDSITSALLISPGVYQGYLSGEQGNDEKDYFGLKLKKGNRVSVKITPPSKDSINLAVYDVNRARLDENTSSGAGEITTLSFIPANDGDYYLEVSCNYGCAKIVNYQMEVTGAVLPTGGGLMATESPPVGQTTTIPPANISPSSVPLVANPLLGNSRDRKYLYIIIGTVLVIIIVTMFLLRHKPPQKDDPQMNSGSPDADKATVGYKHPCKHCNKLIPSNSRSCPFCGKANPQGPLRCPKCNTPIEKDWKICNNCDLPLSVKCPHCGKTTFFGDYCEHCDKRLVVICPNCKTEQPPIGETCKKCNKPLQIENKK